MKVCLSEKGFTGEGEWGVLSTTVNFRGLLEKGDNWEGVRESFYSKCF